MQLLPLRVIRAAAVGGLSTFAVAACGGDDDPFRPVATSETALASFAVVPLSGDPTLPSAVDLSARVAVRPRLLSGTVLNFDFAVDVDAQRRIILLQPGRVAVAPSGTPRTGFVTSTSAFESLGRAPNGGYQYDSVVVVTPGQTVVVQAQAATCSTTYPLYAKLVVDSVSTGADRRVYVRALINPNCGFRSLTAGLPKD